MAWDVVVAMFAGVAAHLLPDGQFILYGPFKIDDRFTSEGNEQFDARLRSDDPSRGIRDLEAIEHLAKLHGMELQKQIPMPANNFILEFKQT